MADGACATNARTPREASLERALVQGWGRREEGLLPGIPPGQAASPPQPPHPRLGRASVAQDAPQGCPAGCKAARGL